MFIIVACFIYKSILIEPIVYMELIYLENKWWKEVSINDYYLYISFSVYKIQPIHRQSSENIVGKFSHVCIVYTRLE